MAINQNNGVILVAPQSSTYGEPPSPRGGNRLPLIAKTLTDAEKILTLANLGITVPSAPAITLPVTGTVVADGGPLAPTDVTATGKVATPPVALAVLAEAAITFAVTSSFMVVDGDAGGNVIGTITGGVPGMELVLKFLDASVTITDTDATTADTVNLAGTATDFVSSAGDLLTLLHDGTQWLEKCRSVN